MKLHVPKYFNEFHCIADQCKDYCCKLWEIDIDKKTSTFYKNCTGEFGQKLKQNIDFKGIPHFILDKKGNCPFLTEKHLCSIYINLGEENMCDICKIHPRYYEWFNGIKEGGIGICCEEACRIILSQTEPFSIVETEIPDEDFDEYDENIYLFLYNNRNKIISKLEDKSLPINTRIKNISNYDNTKLESILKLLSTLESFDSNWIPYINECIFLYPEYIKNYDSFINANPHISQYLQNLSIYFVWRYYLKSVFDGDTTSKLSIMAISVSVIEFLFFCKWYQNGILNFDDCIEIVKNYSKEIEYSEKNLEIISSIL